MKSLQVLMAALALASLTAKAELVVIVNPGNSEVLDKSAVANIFLGKSKSFPSGVKVVPVMVDYNSAVDLEDLLSKIVSKSTSQFRAYWAKMSFSGMSSPPQTFKTSQEIVEIVARNPDIIGLADASAAKGKVKVLNLD